MGADVVYFWAGGIIPPNFQELLQGGGTSNPLVWCRVMSDVPSDWMDPGRFPPQGGPPAGKDVSKEGHDRQVYLSAARRGNKGSGSGGVRDVHPPPPEHRPKYISTHSILALCLV